MTDESIEKTDLKTVAGGDHILPPEDAATIASIAASKIEGSCCTMPVATN